MSRVISEAQRLAGAEFDRISGIRPQGPAAPATPVQTEEDAPTVDVSSFRARFGGSAAVRAPYSAERAPVIASGDRVDAAKALLTDNRVPDNVKGAFLALAVAEAFSGTK